MSKKLLQERSSKRKLSKLIKKITEFALRFNEISPVKHLLHHKKPNLISISFVL